MYLVYLTRCNALATTTWTFGRLFVHACVYMYLLCVTIRATCWLIFMVITGISNARKWFLFLYERRREHCISIIHSIRVFVLHSHLYDTTFSSCARRRSLHTPTFRPFQFDSIRLDFCADRKKSVYLNEITSSMHTRRLLNRKEICIAVPMINQTTNYHLFPSLGIDSVQRYAGIDLIVNSFAFHHIRQINIWKLIEIESSALLSVLRRASVAKRFRWMNRIIFTNKHRTDAITWIRTAPRTRSTIFTWISEFGMKWIKNCWEVFMQSMRTQINSREC